MKLAFALLAVTATLAAALGLDVLHWLTKPTATLVLLGMVWPRPGAYARAVALGLAASAAGDAFLMLPQDLFLPGLACFFVAHLAYIRAFSHDTRLLPDAWAALGAGVLGVAIIAALWPGLPAGMGLPVVAYAGVLALMAAQAVGRARRNPVPGAGLAAAGAMLFLISDTVLALDRFAAPLTVFAGLFPPGDQPGLAALLAQPVVLTTYYAAQACIAGSALVRGGRAR
ncbi:lysoplasmalogenase [Paracoccus jiaweipingae]|uniref:lysoplasmalogenase n=1 Tax=unclassified Paracoccus (in: a-proteobacteria) TaxID=2688777 RepID=UPI0037A5A6AB